MTDVYESCKNVQFPAVEDTIMYFLCGRWGSQDCNPFRWFDFMGSVDNGYAPFQISYEYSNNLASEDGHLYHNPEVVPCNEVAPGQIYRCGCEDCFLSHCTLVNPTTTSPATYPTSPGPGQSSRSAKSDQIDHSLTLILLLHFTLY